MQVDALIRLLTLLNPNQTFEKAARSLVGQANLIFDNEASAIYLPVDGLLRCLAAAGLHSDHLEQTLFPDTLQPYVQQRGVINILQEKEIDFESLDMLAYPAPFSQFGPVILVPLHLVESEMACLVMFLKFGAIVEPDIIENLDVFRRFAQIGLGNIIQYQRQMQEERDKIARDMHDAVTQAMYSLTIMAEGKRRLAASGRLENCVESFAELGDLAQQALRELRLIVHGLRNPLLENLGLVEALRQRLLRVEKRAGVETDLIVEGEIRLPTDLEVEFYRIAEEALSNMLKHSFAAMVICRVSQQAEDVVLEIRDDGRGFTLRDGQENGGMGLSNMAERAEKMGALLEIETELGSGTIVRVTANIQEIANGQ